MDGKKKSKKPITTRKKPAQPQPARPAPDPEHEKKVFIAMKTLTTEPPVKVVDLAAKGPVHLIQTRKGPGLLLHYAQGPDTVVLISLATGQGFGLSRDSARALGGLLNGWAGEGEPAATPWVASEDRWELAK
jgi:hypothetical protein